MSTKNTGPIYDIRGIRFERKLKRKIDAEANKNLRTFGSEVLYLVEQGLLQVAKEREAEAVEAPGQRT